MNITCVKKNIVILSVVVMGSISLVGCGSGGDYHDDGYSYRSEQHKPDQMARDAMYDATDSMSDKELRDLEKNLKKSQGK
jgi:hypothetical protein